MFNNKQLNIMIDALDQWEVEYCANEDKDICNQLIEYFKGSEYFTLLEIPEKGKLLSHSAREKVIEIFSDFIQSLPIEDKRGLGAEHHLRLYDL